VIGFFFSSFFRDERQSQGPVLARQINALPQSPSSFVCLFLFLFVFVFVFEAQPCYAAAVDHTALGSGVSDCSSVPGTGAGERAGPGFLAFFSYFLCLVIFLRRWGVI